MVVAGNLPQAQRHKSIRRVLVVVLVLDLLMALAKGGYGYVTGSIGMISDGLHSTVHAAGGIVGLAGIHFAARPADASHPYGYERYELLAAMGFAVLMLAAVWGILGDAWTRFESHESPQVTGFSFAIVIASIFLTIGLSIWEVRSARALSSTLLQADAARIRSDTLVSGAVLAGLVGVRLGFPVVDPVASVLVAAIIAWTAARIVLGASRVLADAAVGDTDEIAKVARGVPGVNGCHQIRTRGIGGMVRIDLHIAVDPNMTVPQSHRLAEEVDRRIRGQVGGVTEVLIHVGAATLHR